MANDQSTEGKSAAPKTSKLAVAESWAKILGAVGIPLLIAYYGQVISAQQDRANENEKNRKDLMDLGVYILDSDTKKHQFAAILLEMMSEQNIKVPRALIDMATESSNSQNIQIPNTDSTMPPTPITPAHTTLPSDAFAAQKTMVSALGGLVPRVFIEIADENQRAGAEALRQRLQSQSINGYLILAPGVELVPSPPAEFQLRYLRDANADEANQIAQLVSADLGKPAPRPVYLKRYENDPNTRGRTYELWLPKNLALGAN